MFLGGPTAMAVSGAMGGFLLFIIDGAGVLLNRFASEGYRPVDPRTAPADPSALGPSPAQ